MINVRGAILNEFKDKLSKNEVGEEGKVVQRYNVTRAKLEQYFITWNNIAAYEAARFNQDLNAHKKYGTLIVLH